MQIHKFAALFLLPLMLAGCVSFQGLGNVMRGSGRVETETREASGFDQIRVCCGMRLVLSQGESESLTIEAEDNLLPEIVSSVAGGRLTIRFKDDMGSTQYRPTEPIIVTVRAVDIRGLEVSGGGRFEAGPIETDRLEIELSGGSHGELASVQAEETTAEVSGGGRLTGEALQVDQVRLDLSGGSGARFDALQGDALALDASGGGESTIAGSVARQDLNLNGGAELRADDLQSETVIIRMSGSGSSTLWVTGSLDADLSGGARVEYYGRPRVTQDLSGGSELESRGEK